MQMRSLALEDPPPVPLVLVPERVLYRDVAGLLPGQVLSLVIRQPAFGVDFELFPKIVDIGHQVGTQPLACCAVLDQEGVARNHRLPHAAEPQLRVLVLDYPQGAGVQAGSDRHFLKPAELGTAHGRGCKALHVKLGYGKCTFLPAASASNLILSPYLTIASPVSEAATILNTFLRAGSRFLVVVTAQVSSPRMASFTLKARTPRVLSLPTQTLSPNLTSPSPQSVRSLNCEEKPILVLVLRVWFWLWTLLCRCYLKLNQCSCDYQYQLPMRVLVLYRFSTEQLCISYIYVYKQQGALCTPAIKCQPVNAIPNRSRASRCYW